MLTIGISLILLVLFDTVRQSRRELLVKKYAYKLFRLRDELRELVLKRQVEKSNWIFNYLDSSITRSVSVLPKLNPVYFFSTITIQGRNEEFRYVQKQLENELKQPGNMQLKKIRESFADLLGAYLRERHLLLRLFIDLASWIRRIFENLWKYWRDMLRMGTETSETSTLLNYTKHKDMPIGMC